MIQVRVLSIDEDGSWVHVEVTQPGHEPRTDVLYVGDSLNINLPVGSAIVD